MINRVVLVGRLTKDVELKYTPTGIANARFTLAVNRAFTNGSGEREADFISCVAWRKQAENMANFLKKGSLIGVDGRIQTGNYEGQDGKRIYTTDVVADSVQFLEPRGGGQQAPGAPSEQPATNTPPSAPPRQQGGAGAPPTTYYNPPPPANQDPFSTGGGPIEVSDDDLPF